MPSAPPDVMDALAGSLDNLALGATKDKTTLQQLTAANLALTTTVATLTIPNKKLTDTVTRFNLPRGVKQVVEGKTNPEPSGAITVGRMGTKHCTPVKPVRLRRGFRVTRRPQL
jgi:hypothetical protein